MKWRLTAATGWTTALVGCAPLTDTSELTEPSRPPAVLDAAVRSATRSEASSDATPVSADAAAEVGPPPRCCLAQSPAPFFCQDFEDGNLTTAFRAGGPTTVPSPLLLGSGKAAMSTSARSGGFAFGATLEEAPGGAHQARYDIPATVLDAHRLRL